MHDLKMLLCDWLYHKKMVAPALIIIAELQLYRLKKFSFAAWAGLLVTSLDYAH